VVAEPLRAVNRSYHLVKFISIPFITNELIEFGGVIPRFVPWVMITVAKGFHNRYTWNINTKKFVNTIYKSSHFLCGLKVFRFSFTTSPKRNVIGQPAFDFLSGWSSAPYSLFCCLSEFKLNPTENLIDFWGVVRQISFRHP
jgi:hypothetical protein